VVSLKYVSVVQLAPGGTFFLTFIVWKVH